MKKFFQEFKKFISRGNVMDMAVGTIIGAAFTAIVTALSNGILKPIINMVLYYCFGGDNDALDKMYTVLVKVYKVEDGKQVLDLANSILIDWGAFISAIINFLLVAFVLFLIIKTFNNIKDGAEKSKNIDSRIEFKKSKGIKLTKKEQAYLVKKQAALEAAEAEAKKKEEEASKPAPKDPVVVLLEEIRDSLNKNEQ
ncbi:MAG: large conductance mechanosensitive channel protein MscL [Acholeplasmatales bacterium]|nr:large conductance mechanosensitive channel protein MscL [Acholeplasmatales bacterium]